MSQDKPLDTPDLWNQAVFDKFDLPVNSPVTPGQLTTESEIQFRCHKGVSCFNECCMSIDLTLTPYDVVRMSRRLEITTTQFISAFTHPFDLDAHGMPGLKLKPVEGGSACIFVRPEGCSIYDDRPTACRYYPLGIMGMRRKDEAELQDVFFMVKEPHCKGHDEDRKLSVAQYRREQQVEPYDDLNRDWFDIIVKKRSAGPTIGTPSERSFQLFYLASYDLDGFRGFTQSSGFTDMFALDDDERRAIDEDDAALLRFSMRFMKQVFFGENTIAKRDGADARRYDARKDAIVQKHHANVEKHSLRDPQSEAEDQGS